MKKCDLCNSTLKQIGTIKPGSPYSKGIAELSAYDGAIYFFIFGLMGFIFVQPILESHLYLSSIILGICGAIGAYLWQKPRPFYKCIKCGTKYYGRKLNRYYGE